MQFGNVFLKTVVDFLMCHRSASDPGVPKPSRIRDYLKQLVDEGVLEIEGEYKYRKYKK